MPRFHCPVPLAAGATLDLPPAAARHVQVLRLQPGDALTLFDGRGGEWAAAVTAMGRREVSARVGAFADVSRGSEPGRTKCSARRLATALWLAASMPLA